MNQIKLTFPGTFGKKEIKTELFIPDTELTKIVIFFHGCCSGPYDTKLTKYQIIAPELSQKTVAAVAFYQSSRKYEKSELSADKLQKFAELSFKGKTIFDELTDAQTTVRGIIKYLSKTTQKKLSLVFVGFSLGGLLASALAEEFKPKTIITFGSALGFKLVSSTPILGQGIPKEFQDKLVKSAASYKNALFSIHGSADTTAPVSNAEKLFKLFPQAQKQFLSWPGVDHRFMLRNDMNQESQIIREIIAFLTEKTLT